MILNPANYVAGLLDERASAVRSGDDALVADIDGQIAAASAELGNFDAAGLDADQRAFIADVRQRLAAAESGDYSHGTPAPAAPSLHNPANYVAGLLDERDQAVRAGRNDTVAEIDAELAQASPLLATFDVSGQDEDAVAFVAGVRRRLEASKRTRKAEVGATDTAPDKRTAKAAAPPRTAATPAS